MSKELDDLIDAFGEACRDWQAEQSVGGDIGAAKGRFDEAKAALGDFLCAFPHPPPIYVWYGIGPSGLSRQLVEQLRRIESEQPPAPAARG